jgi:hypothetical protein
MSHVTPFVTNTATILVLFILLTIISRVIGFGAVGLGV